MRHGPEKKSCFPFAEKTPTKHNAKPPFVLPPLMPCEPDHEAVFHSSADNHEKCFLVHLAAGSTHAPPPEASPAPGVGTLVQQLLHTGRGRRGAEGTSGGLILLFAKEELNHHRIYACNTCPEKDISVRPGWAGWSTEDQGCSSRQMYRHRYAEEGMCTTCEWVSWNNPQLQGQS